MADLTETNQWPDGIYQLEQTDAAEGGADGIMNLQAKQLAARSQWLRQFILDGMRQMSMQDSDGDAHIMIWVPRFRIPADLFGTGVPAQELKLGGFLVDALPASSISFPGGVLKAASNPNLQPAEGATVAEAQAQAALRALGQSSAEVMGPREWGHLAWLIRVVGAEVKGNFDGGRDPRDANAWENYAEPGYGQTYPGTSPQSWASNGQANGIVELLGNRYHMLPATVQGGALLIERSGELAEDIDDLANEFEIIDHMGDHAPNAGFAGWPASNGLVRISDELIVYEDLVINGGDPSRATLTNCSRGEYGTSADSHSEGDACHNQHWVCLIPNGYTGVAADGGLDNTDDESTFSWHYGPYGHGDRDESIQEDDILCCGIEDMQVQSVVGDQVTVLRGYNGTTKVAHPFGSTIACYSPDMTRTEQGKLKGFVDGTIRTGADVEDRYLAAATTVDAPEGDLKSSLYLNIRDDMTYLLRGGWEGSFLFTGGAEDMLAAYVDTLSSRGFRCFVRGAEYQYGG
jgi:hypothetical protein